MESVIQEVRMRRLAGRATIGLALSASAMSLVSAWVVPLGPFWPSLAWAVVGCVAGLWAFQALAGPTAVMGDVIAGVEAEPPAVVPAPAPSVFRRGAES